MKFLFSITVALLCLYPSIAQSTEPEVDTLYFPKTKVGVPPVDHSVPPVYLLAKPVREESTPSIKYKPGDWANVDYSQSSGRRWENFFAYVVNAHKQQEYQLYYKGRGKEISSEELKSIPFMSMQKAKTHLPKYLKIVTPGRNKNLMEVYRWQHPNMHVVTYDKKRSGYYLYRIALVIYEDPNHPEAKVFIE